MADFSFLAAVTDVVQIYLARVCCQLPPRGI